MNTKQIEQMRDKVLQTADKVYTTKVYQYWIDAAGHLVRARREHLDTTAMNEDGAVEELD